MKVGLRAGCCAGTDVGRKFLVVCVMIGSLDSEPKTEIRRFGTIVDEGDGKNDSSEKIVGDLRLGELGK
jgi:hypothetical protein